MTLTSLQEATKKLIQGKLPRCKMLGKYTTPNYGCEKKKKKSDSLYCRKTKDLLPFSSEVNQIQMSPRVK